MTPKLDKDKITAHFGAEFYAKLINDLENYSQLWTLSELFQIDYYSVNCIFKCVSAKYGLCILKIGKPSRETATEASALREYSGTRYCKIYESDISRGVLLIEQITPGVQLRAVPSLDKRLDLFCEVFRGLHIKSASSEFYPTYMRWVSRITEFMRSQGEHELLYKQMANAEQICRSLCEKYPVKVLLHGDLHHDNILLDCHSQYRIIDPKGVIGDTVFDIPRFILNEFDDVLNDDFSNKFRHITKTLSAKLNLSERDIRRLTYVEMCMSNCWSVEDKQPLNLDAVLFTEKLINEPCMD